MHYPSSWSWKDNDTYLLIKNRMVAEVVVSRERIPLAVLGVLRGRETQRRCQNSRSPTCQFQWLDITCASHSETHYYSWLPREHASSSHCPSVCWSLRCALSPYHKHTQWQTCGWSHQQVAQLEWWERTTHLERYSQNLSNKRHAKIKNISVVLSSKAKKLAPRHFGKLCRGGLPYLVATFVRSTKLLYAGPG